PRPGGPGCGSRGCRTTPRQRRPAAARPAFAPSASRRSLSLSSWTCSSCHRKSDHYAQSAVVLRGLQGNRCTVVLHDALDDGQAQAAADLAGALAAREAIEGAAAEIRGHAGAVVGDREHRFVAPAYHGDVDLAAALDIADGVVDEIAQHHA